MYLLIYLYIYLYVFIEEMCPSLCARLVAEARKAYALHCVVTTGPKIQHFRQFSAVSHLRNHISWLTDLRRQLSV